MIDHAVYILSHHWEFTLQEIADLFGFSEAWACLRLGHVEARVFAALQKEERRPDQEAARRMAEDAERARLQAEEVARVREAQRQGLAGRADPRVASEKSRTLEVDHEEGFPEWFA